MKNIYAVTHTESIHHEQKLGGGWFDTPLTDRGRDQAKQTAKYLKKIIKEEPVVFYCSDLLRASETCEIIASEFNKGINRCRELREMCYGDAEGKTDDWIRKNITLSSRTNRLDHKIFPNAESRRQVGTRIKNKLEEIIEVPSSNIVIVTHGFALSFVIMAWLKMPVNSMGYGNFGATPGGITFLQEDDYFKNRNVVYFNKTDHLKNGKS